MSAASEVLPVRSDVALIAFVGFAHAVSHFFHLVIPLLFPWLMPAFGLSYTQAGLLMTVFFIASGLGQALAGLVVDRVGSRPVLFFGLLLLAVSGVLLGIAQNYAMLMLSATVAGIGNSVFHPADFALLNRQVGKPRLGHAFSVHGISGNLGWAAAPLVITTVAAYAGWRSAAFSAGAIALIPCALLYVLNAAIDGGPAAKEGSRQAEGSETVSTLAVLRSPTVLLCFVFFFLISVAFGALQNFSTSALKAVYALSLTGAASCLSAYLFGTAAGIAAGGFLASRRAQELTIAVCICFAAGISLVLASGVVAAAAVLPLMALMGIGMGIAGPSRDLLIRRASTQGLGAASYGRVYGFVYSGMDSGQAVAPLIFGTVMDGSHFTLLWVGIALFQGLAVLSALRVGRSVPAERV
jgi:MFS family permease